MKFLLQVRFNGADKVIGELDGYYVYDAAGLDAAIAFAARIPVARFGGTIEVRPVLER